MARPQVHVSMLATWSRCGEQARRRYGARFGLAEKEEIIPPGIALIVGISTHITTEKDLQHKIETGDLLPDEAVKELAFEQASGLWMQPVRLTEEEATASTLVKKESIDTTIALSILHHEKVAPQIEPLAVEQPWVLLNEGGLFDLAGKIDIVEKNGSVRDTKTASKRPTIADADNSLQLTMYALAQLTKTGSLPRSLYIDALVKNEKKPTAVTIGTLRTQRDIDMLMRRIERISEVIDKGQFTPADPADRVCSPKWCGYWDSCPFANR